MIELVSVLLACLVVLTLVILELSKAHRRQIDRLVEGWSRDRQQLIDRWQDDRQSLTDRWQAERQQLLDRIQAPSFDHLKHHEVKMFKAQNGARDPAPLEQL